MLRVASPYAFHLRMRSTSRILGVTWVALTCSFALHVWDEAVHDFLSIYNPNVEAIRSRWPLIPLPTFTVTEFVVGLSAAILLMAFLAPAAFRGRGWLTIVAYPYGVIMLMNGVQHITVSLYLGSPLPGVMTSPLLIVSSVALLLATRRVRQPAADPSVANDTFDGRHA
jgi:hypothetical protein